MKSLARVYGLSTTRINDNPNLLVLFVERPFWSNLRFHSNILSKSFEKATAKEEKKRFRSPIQPTLQDQDQHYHVKLEQLFLWRISTESTRSQWRGGSLGKCFPTRLVRCRCWPEGGGWYSQAITVSTPPYSTTPVSSESTGCWSRWNPTVECHWQHEQYAAPRQFQHQDWFVKHARGRTSAWFWE